MKDDSAVEPASKVSAMFKHGYLLLGGEHYPDLEVRSALVTWAIGKGVKYGHLMDVLRWDSMNKCWCFGWAGMYVGVEPDGHIHT